MIHRHTFWNKIKLISPTPSIHDVLVLYKTEDSVKFISYSHFDQSVQLEHGKLPVYFNVF